MNFRATIDTMVVCRVGLKASLSFHTIKSKQLPIQPIKWIISNHSKITLSMEWGCPHQNTRRTFMNQVIRITMSYFFKWYIYIYISIQMLKQQAGYTFRSYQRNQPCQCIWWMCVSFEGSSCNDIYNFQNREHVSVSLWKKLRYVRDSINLESFVAKIPVDSLLCITETSSE